MPGNAVSNLKYAFLGFILLLVWWLILRAYPPKWPTESDVKSWLKAWEQRFGKLEHWISEPGLEMENSRAKPYAVDIHEYGIDKLLIVDSELLVDVLVRNHWHADRQTLVVAASGYPSSATQLANRYLQENPDLKVYLYHASAHKNFENSIRQRGMIKLGAHAVVDVGLNDEILSKHRFFKKRYNKIPKGVVHTDHVPIASMLGLMSAAVAGELLLSAVLNDPSRVSVEFESDFG